MKKKSLFMGLAILALSTIILGCQLNDEKENNALTNISIQLKWLNQAQFAGLYVAQEKGFYKEEGLDATFLPFSFEEDGPIEKTANGSVDFGVTGATELALARSDGIKAMAIAAIYKKSPFTLYSLKENNILYPKDLEGKRIGIQTGTDGELLFKLMLNEQGIDENKITKIPIQYTVGELIRGDVDASMGYIINEPYQAIEAGYEISNMLMADYGPNMYGDVLITSDNMIENNPDLVLRFLRASLKGWTYAIENPDKSLPIILKYASDSNWGHESYMLKESIPLIHTGNAPIGWMEDKEWETIQKIISDAQKRNITSMDINCHTMKFLNKIYNRQ